MPTLQEVGDWISANVLDASAWVNAAAKQALAVTQAERNLVRWYPAVTLTYEHVALQAIWELQGLDPALKFQKQGVKSVTDNGEGITYGVRDVVAPDVRQLLGAPVFEGSDGQGSDVQYGGCLL